MKEIIISHSKPWINKCDIEAVKKVLNTGIISESNLSKTFEKSIAKYTGIKHCMLTATGTHALILALWALDIDATKSVIIPTYTCRALLDAILFLKAKPIIVDIGEDYCIRFDAVEKIVKNKKKQIGAIIPVHQFGIPCNVDELKTLGIPIVEDCCQSIGARFNGKLTGTMGNLAVFSFHATKLITTGEGGAVCTNDTKLFKKLVKLKTGGNPFGRYNYRFFSPLSDFQSALGLSQLKRLDLMLEKRQKIANCYANELCKWVQPIFVKQGQCFFRFPLMHKKSSIIIEKLNKIGINARKPVNPMLHQLLKECMGSDYKIAEKKYRDTFSLPLYPNLSYNYLEYIIKQVKKILKK